MATKKAKRVSKRVIRKGTTSNFDKIRRTAKKANKEILTTATELLEDVKENGTTIKEAASITLDKIQLKDSLQKVVKTTKKVNAQIVETASEVVEDVVENGKKWGATAMEMVKNRIEDIDVKANMEQIKTTTKNVSDFTLNTADDMVDSALENGKKWQGVAEKAVKGGLHLAERQQDIVFDTLETVKGQIIHSTKRLKNIFSKN